MLSLCLLFSCSGNKANSFYTDVNKIYSECNAKTYEFLSGKEKSEKKTALYLSEKLAELNAITEFPEGKNLKTAIENDIKLWRDTFELSDKINNGNLSIAEKSILNMKRLHLQMERNPVSDQVKKENNLFAEKFSLASQNTLINIKNH